MELKINVDETKFGELINDELSNFTKEEIHEICRDGLVKIMSNQESLQDILPKESDYWGNKIGVDKLLNEAAKKIDLSPVFAEFEKNAREYVENHYKDIIMDVMANVFVKGLSETLYASDFAQWIKNDMKCFMYPHQ